MLVMQGYKTISTASPASLRGTLNIGCLFSLRNIFNIEAEHQRPQKIWGKFIK